jgi:1-acyl-sn-glycerol-3-phosphate acyltransferase
MLGAVVWLAMLVAFYFMSTFLEERAAMRGSHRTPLPSWVDKSIRVFFLVTLMAPLYAVLPWPWLFIVLLLAYLPTYLDNGEKTGKRVSQYVKNFVGFKLVKWYFHMDVVAAGGKLDPKRQYLLGVHPHGFLPVGTMIAMLTDVCGIESKVLNGVKMRTLAASFCFYIPAYRDLILGGGIIDAARYNAHHALEQGYSLSLVPGGATEGLYASPGKHILVLKKRKGFIKLALEHGCDLVPVYSFGENNCYNQLSDVWPRVRKFQDKFQRVLGLSLPLVKNIFPHRTTITVCFGKPIPVQKVVNPTDEQVQALLDTYIAKLREHFEENAPKYIPNPAERELVIL